jgi:protein-S-isoprenylcysteine O-methyltransferase Ste14
MKGRHVAVEILPRALWVIMAICLYRCQHLANDSPALTENALLMLSGVLIVIGGFLIWIYVGYYMRRALFDKTFVTDGPFRHVRHPMYLGIYIMLAGVGLLFFSQGWFAVMLAFVPIWYLDGRIEEKQMIEIHGTRYRDYRERTGMFLPMIRGKVT